jgi:hypothetical protein
MGKQTNLLKRLRVYRAYTALMANEYGSGEAEDKNIELVIRCREINRAEDTMSLEEVEDLINEHRTRFR